MRVKFKKSDKDKMAESNLSTQQTQSNNMKFKWTSELIESLITSLAAFETRMEYNNVDFNADKPRQYEEIRK